MKIAQAPDGQRLWNWSGTTGRFGIYFYRDGIYHCCAAAFVDAWRMARTAVLVCAGEWLFGSWFVATCAVRGVEWA